MWPPYLLILWSPFSVWGELGALMLCCVPPAWLWGMILLTFMVLLVKFNFLKVRDPNIISCFHTLSFKRKDGSQSLFPFTQFILWSFSMDSEEHCICVKWKELNGVCWFRWRRLFVSMQKPNATWEADVLFPGQYF